ncbi:molybdate ABC transporter substrate-binding protein [Novispirillum sp. DQ9]|uniref:molybdate ABC transporter substrate-binding protein n=1 Tax=Novispirillum sp. DQ9 TaxID=3398612 RepID=UPI003C7B56A8
MKHLLRTAAITLALTLAALPARAGETLVAVAANFTAAANEVAEAFTKATGHTVKYSFGPTGQFYTQITQGAPFEVFLAADAERPAKAEAEGFAVEGTRFAYAVGKLVLWSADPALVDAKGEVLKSGTFAKIAIASPAAAPYGAAAVETMKALGLYDTLEPKIVQGSSIAQTHQFVATGNAQVGFVALAQIALEDKGSRWVVPESLYSPIVQDAVLLKAGAANEAAKAYLAFLRGPEAKAIIERYGYGVMAGS